MSLVQDGLSVQGLYPKLYVACHSTHGRATGVAGNVSARDCAVLSHLWVDPTLSASRLAKHLGVGRSTLSEVVSRLVEQKFLESYQDHRDERKND